MLTVSADRQDLRFFDHRFLTSPFAEKHDDPSNRPPTSFPFTPPHHATVSHHLHLARFPRPPESLTWGHLISSAVGGSLQAVRRSSVLILSLFFSLAFGVLEFGVLAFEYPYLG